MIKPEFLEILACPLCASRPRLRIEGELLVCTECGSGFRVQNGIPHLVRDEAIPADKLKEKATDG